MKTVTGRAAAVSMVAFAMLLLAGTGAGASFDVVLQSQGEYLDAYRTDQVDPATGGPKRYAFIVPDDPAHGGRHINGKACFFPPTYKDDLGLVHANPHQGDFVASDDTFDEVCLAPALRGDLPAADRCSPGGRYYVGNDPAGWAILHRDGSWAQKDMMTGGGGWISGSGRVIHTDGCGPHGQGDLCDLNALTVTDPASYDPNHSMATQGTIDPQGCFFDADGNLWGTDVGHDGDPTDHDGALIVFFAASDYRDYCFVDRALFSPAMPTYDAASGAIYLAESGAGHITKFAGPFPKSQADCSTLPDHTVTIPPTKTVFAAFPVDGTATPAALVAAPASGFYVASVLFPGGVVEIDADGFFSQYVVGPSLPNVALAGNAISPPDGSPAYSAEGLDVGSDGAIYFADLNLQTDPTQGKFFSTGCGKTWMAAPNAPPVLIGDGLRFPDGVSVASSDQVDVSAFTAPLVLDPTSCRKE